MRTKASTAVIAIALALAYSPAKAGTITYDAIADFNASGNQASGSSWTYGTTRTLNGAFTLLPYFAATSCASTGCSPSDAAFDAYYSRDVGGGPDIERNNSGGTITYFNNPSMVWPDNVLQIGPGGQYDGSPSFTVLRWTAQQSGTYSISGFMENLQASTTDQYVYIGGTQVFSQSYGGATSLQQESFAFNNLALTIGDNVDFIVDSGGNFLQDRDVIGLSATITSDISATPEPASFISMAIGAGLLMLAGRRSRTC